MPSKRRIGRRWKQRCAISQAARRLFAARASADRPTDLVERLNLRADTMTQRGAALKKLADAARPLYKSLDNVQRHRMVLLVRLTGAGFDGERSLHRHRSWMMGHRGFGSGGAGGWFDGGQRPR